jgi:hypothetical protein
VGAVMTGGDTLQQQLVLANEISFPGLIEHLASSGRAPALAALGRHALGLDFGGEYTPAQAITQAGRELGQEAQAPWLLCRLLGRITSRSVEPRQLSTQSGMEALAEGVAAFEKFPHSLARLIMTSIDVKLEAFEGLTTLHSFEVSEARLLVDIAAKGGEATESKLSQSLIPIELPRLEVAGRRAERNSQWALKEIVEPEWKWGADVLANASLEQKAAVLEAFFDRYINRPSARPFSGHRPLRSVTLLHLYCEGYLPKELLQARGLDVGGTRQMIERQVGILRASLTAQDAQQIYTFLESAQYSTPFTLGPARMSPEALRKSLDNLPVWPGPGREVKGDPRLPVTEHPAFLLYPPFTRTPPRRLAERAAPLANKDWEMPSVGVEDLNPLMFDVLIHTLFAKTPIYALVAGTPEIPGATRQQQIEILQALCRRYLGSAKRPSSLYRDPQKSVDYLWSYATEPGNLKSLSAALNTIPRVVRETLGFLLGQFYWGLTSKDCVAIQAFINGKADEVELGPFEPYPGKAPVLQVLLQKRQAAARDERARAAQAKRAKRPNKAQRAKSARSPRASSSPRPRAQPLPKQVEAAIRRDSQSVFGEYFRSAADRLQVPKTMRAALTRHTSSVPEHDPTETLEAVRHLQEKGKLGQLLAARPLRNRSSQEVAARFFGLGDYEPQSIGSIRKIGSLMYALEKEERSIYGSLAEFLHNWHEWWSEPEA